MVKELVAQLWNCFKDGYGVEVNDSADLFDSQRDILEFIVGVGRKLEESLFIEIGTGYQGTMIKRKDKR